MARRYVRLVATARFTYDGRSFSIGEFFEAPYGDAHMLVSSHRASLSTAAPVAPGGESDQPPAKLVERQKRVYKRRDMVAEK